MAVAGIPARAVAQATIAPRHAIALFLIYFSCLRATWKTSLMGVSRGLPAVSGGSHKSVYCKSLQ